VQLDDKGFVYATLPATPGMEDVPAITWLAHVDTSHEASGENVKPRFIENYDGGTITFPDDSGLTLTTKDSPALANFKGDTIITASGKTLLGADNKAGIAEIMEALSILIANSEIAHGEIRVCFTRDEEIGRGVDGIDTSRISKVCYTVDGSTPGEFNIQTWDAWRLDITLIGINVHPGYAMGKMLDAQRVAAKLLLALPEDQLPATTEGDQGFFHVVDSGGNAAEFKLMLITRDFDKDKNLERVQFVKDLLERLKEEHPGLRVEITKEEHQYPNMLEFFADVPEIAELGREAIRRTGLEPEESPIRGGTDGSKLSAMGHPCPNLFAGGEMFHGCKEWIPLNGGMCKAVEMLLHLAYLWSEQKATA